MSRVTGGLALRSLSPTFVLSFLVFGEAGCEILVGIEDSRLAPDAGANAGTGGSSPDGASGGVPSAATDTGAGGQAGAGASAFDAGDAQSTCDGASCARECSTAADPACDDANPCTTDGCDVTMGICEHTLLDGAPPSAIAGPVGDCTRELCLAGQVVTMTDDADVPPDDPDDCIDPTCIAGMPAAIDRTDGAPCGGGVCSVGVCSGCGDDALDPGEICDDGNTGGGDGCSAACAIEPNGLIINEVMSDPVGASPASSFDSNCDGAVDSSEDEYVEIVNRTAGSVDLSGMTIWDTYTTPTLRHTVAQGVVLGAGEAMVVFGGGSITCVALAPTGSVRAAVASTGFLGLNNGAAADIVELVHAGETISRAECSGDGVSLTLSPDLADTDSTDDPTVTGMVSHLVANPALRGSPGVRINGTEFP